MISEESCDTEDWSNDAENSALITEINYILTDICIKQLFWNVIILHNIFFCIVDQINAALVSKKDFKNILKKSFWPQTFAQ